MINIREIAVKWITEWADIIFIGVIFIVGFSLGALVL